MTIDPSRLRSFAVALRATLDDGADFRLASGDVGRFVMLTDLESLIDVYEAAVAYADEFRCIDPRREMAEMEARAVLCRAVDKARGK